MSGFMKTVLKKIAPMQLILGNIKLKDCQSYFPILSYLPFLALVVFFALEVNLSRFKIDLRVAGIKAH